MKKQLRNIIIVFLMAFTFSCIDDIEKDDEIPVIDMTAAEAFPKTCDMVYRGESFTFTATFTDNVALGSFSIEMHNNFNHHTHSTDVVECEMDPIKSAVNPLLFIEEYDIPEGQKSYTASIKITIPEDVDTGDYHFMVRLTDAAGWQALKGISVKIAEKP
jgi:hypothetical protein